MEDAMESSIITKDKIEINYAERELSRQRSMLL